VPPGGSAVIERVVYRGLIAPEDVELFDLGDPLPEDRDEFWELRADA